MTVLEANEKSNISDFSMVHDSYGVHACDWPEFHKIIRRNFWEIYRNDILAKLLLDLESYATHIKFPEPPKPGTLNIHQVLHSKYFFA